MINGLNITILIIYMKLIVNLSNYLHFNTIIFDIEYYLKIPIFKIYRVHSPLKLASVKNVVENGRVYLRSYWYFIIVF